jgi:chromosome segregation ATPase
VSEAIAAVISGLVALIVGMWANRRAKEAADTEAKRKDRESRVRSEELSQRQVEVITAAYASVIEELRNEASRLTEARKADHAQWTERRGSLEAQLDQLEQELKEERQERVRLQARLEVVEAELARVEKRRGRYDVTEDEA